MAMVGFNKERAMVNTLNFRAVFGQFRLLSVKVWPKGARDPLERMLFWTLDRKNACIYFSPFEDEYHDLIYPAGEEKIGCAIELYEADKQQFIFVIGGLNLFNKYNGNFFLCPVLNEN